MSRISMTYVIAPKLIFAEDDLSAGMVEDMVKEVRVFNPAQIEVELNYTDLMERYAVGEDDEATAADIQEITLKQIFLRGRYNELGILANDRLMLLVEAQSTWTGNIIPRAIVYIGDTLNRYAFSHRLKWYSRKKVAVLRVELYVVYTGNQKIDKTEINLTDEFYGGVKCDIDATVHVIVDSGKNDILDQYITFCKIVNEQRALFPDTDEGRADALREAIRKCIEKNILSEYLQNRQEEVMNIMLTIFDEENQRKLEIEEEREEERKNILTLMNKLLTAGRMEDAKRAANDMTFCQKLLVEFGLAKA